MKAGWGELLKVVVLVLVRVTVVGVTLILRIAVGMLLVYSCRVTVLYLAFSLYMALFGPGVVKRDSRTVLALKWRLLSIVIRILLCTGTYLTSLFFRHCTNETVG